MIAEIGHYALVLALALALIQSTLPIWGARTGDAGLMRIAPSTALAQLAFILLAFAALLHAHMTSDFSVLNVVENSHSQKPLLYKVTGVWGNHEGSMLLWVTILALFGSLVAAFAKNLPLSMKATVLAVQAWITAAFLLFILVTSNPFARLARAPIEGQDLNPVLQDIGLAIHPPLLYLGYVGFSITFAFAAAALIEGRIDAAWARWVRPWVLTAWIFLTLGIAMGSYWAYYELGWGGWWFWDPVENASLMPWIAGTALLHSAAVMEKREALKVWTLLLAILAFSLSLLGTFLVRSGVLTSVHAFANDPTRGVFILAILVLFIGGGLGLFAFGAPRACARAAFSRRSRAKPVRVAGHPVRTGLRAGGGGRRRAPAHEGRPPRGGSRRGACRPRRGHRGETLPDRVRPRRDPPALALRADRRRPRRQPRDHDGRRRLPPRRRDRGGPAALLGP